MADGAKAANEFVLRSGVRSGLKREFAFALKAQAELSDGGSPAGRTRSGKIRGEDVCGAKGRGGRGLFAGSRRGRKRKESSSVAEGVGNDRDLMEVTSSGRIDAKWEAEMDIGVVGDRIVSVSNREEENASGREVRNVEEENAADVKREETVSERNGEEAKVSVVRSGETVLENTRSVMQPSGNVLDGGTVLENTEGKEGVQRFGKEEMLLENNGQVVGVDVRVHPRIVPQRNGVEISLCEDPPRNVDGTTGRDVLEGDKVIDMDMDMDVPQSECESLKGSSFAEGFAAGTPAFLQGQDDQRHVCAPELPSNTILTNSKKKYGKTVPPFIRRFTRSLLKSPTEEAPPTGELSSTVTSSDSSDGSEVMRGGEANSSNGPSGPLRTSPKKKLEMKMSKKIALTKLPRNVKDLLGTGLLEGLPVKYIASTKKRGEALHGVIKNCGILCSCSFCNGTNVISAYQFELHAGSGKKHPSDYIFLENGKSIHDVLRACNTAPLDLLESTILNAISSGSNTLVSICNNCNESYQMQPARVGKLSSICDSCLVERLTPIHKDSASMPYKTKKLQKSSIASNSSDNSSTNILSLSQKKSYQGQGRVTTKDLWLHKLVFMNDTLPDGTEVAYYARGQRLLEGYIKGSGIFCSCCSSVVSPSQFEAHAGYAQRRKPYLNIYTSNGVSLHELSVSLSKDKTYSARENDDLCRICADGGDLLLCDLCPRAFHKECVGLSSLPTGDWYCPCCEAMHQRENYVSSNENAIAAGRVYGIDPIEQIFQRCIRIVQTPGIDTSSCVLCNCHDFSKSGFGPRTVLLCDQCEKEFHIGCLKEQNIADLKELPQGKWFCCSECNRIHDALQTILLSGSQQLPDRLLENIKRKKIEKGLSNDTELDVRWRLLNGKMATPDCRLMLSKAVSIFHETFDPIIDVATGQDLIPAMIYGRDIRHQDFGGMVCAILTVNSTVVSAGVLRVLGCETAELPLVATTMECQGYGLFQSLFSCIETLLDSLNVKHLVLPATKEAEAIWTTKFGFSEISQKQVEEYTKGSRTMNFQGTPMLHKPLSASRATGEGDSL